MAGIYPLILVGSLVIPFHQGEDRCMLEVKQSRSVSSENIVPRKILWSLWTPTGLSCADLCLQNNSCLFYGYQSHVCHGYSSSETQTTPVQIPVTGQGHVWKYKSKATQGGMTEQNVTVHKSKDMNPQAIKDHKSKAVNDGYIHLTSRRTHLYVKKHLNGKRRHEALEVCQAEGATLAKLDSRTKIRLFRKECRSRHGDVESFWIGLSDRYDNDTWYWTDGTRLSRYSNWGLGEPNHRQKGKKQNCVGIALGMFYSGKWFDSYCTETFTFVCERVWKRP